MSDSNNSKDEKPDLSNLVDARLKAREKQRRENPNDLQLLSQQQAPKSKKETDQK